MQRVSGKHRALGRSIAELDARDPGHNKLPPPVSSIPIVGPLVGNGGAAPPPPPNPQPAPISTPDSGSGSGNGGGSTPTPVASPTSGGGFAVSPVSIIPSSTSPTPAPGEPSSPPSANSASSGDGTINPSSTSSAGYFVGADGGKSIPANVESGSSTPTSAALAMSVPATVATAFPQSLLGSGSNTVGTSSPFPNTTTGAASSGNQLSGGAIAGITIVSLFFFLAFIFLVIRRRSIARRMELRRQWWPSHNPSGGSFSFVSNGNLRSPVGSGGEDPASRLSARSSFATNFDEGLMLHVDSPQRFSFGVVPDRPPMAEVRERNSVLISTGGAMARRESMNSMLSNDSEQGTQYLKVSAGQNNLEPSTPMCVRPFSPSESFAFPKPPAPRSSTTDSFFISRTQGAVSPRSSATLVHLSTPPRAFMTDLPPPPVLAHSLHPQTSMPSVTPSPFIAAANPSIDPFADPLTPGFADVEVVRRPFAPSLDDELSVCPDDRVRLLQIFDDGWVFVEKLGGTEGERHERGLIPVDCLRETSQALPTFLAKKRVSYGSDQLIATAL